MDHFVEHLHCVLCRLWCGAESHTAVSGILSLNIMIKGFDTFPSIVLRAFQGIGGAGNFALGTAMATELVPPTQYPAVAVSIAAVYALSLLVGPIMGGALSSNATWRWCFLIK